MKSNTRLMIGFALLALVFLGARMGHRNWWLGKIVRDTKQEIVDMGFKLEKLESPISPQPEAPVRIDTLEQFIEEAKMVGVETIYFLPHPEGPSFYLGPKRMYLYSYKLIIVPLTTTLFPRYVRPSEKQAFAYASTGVPFIERLFWTIGFPLILFGLFVFIQKKILRNIDER